MTVSPRRRPPPNSAPILRFSAADRGRRAMRERIDWPDAPALKDGTGAKDATTGTTAILATAGTHAKDASPGMRRMPERDGIRVRADPAKGGRVAKETAIL